MPAGSITVHNRDLHLNTIPIYDNDDSEMIKNTLTYMLAFI